MRPGSPMSDQSPPTCWHLIRGAASGAADDREEFARRYLPAVRAYLRARWGRSPLASEVEDVVQEVFLELLKSGGVLESADSGHGQGFRALLFAVSRNVALQAERKRSRRANLIGDGAFEPDGNAAEDPTLSRVFDRTFAQSVVRQARDRMDLEARRAGGEFLRRAELLRLHFEEGLPIRDIATLWQVDAAVLHREYAKARREFQDALHATIAGGENWSAERVTQECERLLVLLRD